MNKVIEKGSYKYNFQKNKLTVKYIRKTNLNKTEIEKTIDDAFDEATNYYKKNDVKSSFTKNWENQVRYTLFSEKGNNEK